MDQTKCFCELILCLSDALEDNVKERILALPFGIFEKERLLSMKNKAARNNSLCSLLCLEKLLHKKGFDKCDTTILRDTGGKPYFTSVPLCFSISHSGNLCAVAISNENIGIDVEFIDEKRNIDAVARRFFKEDENLTLKDDTSRKKFFRLWTRKEAYAKFTGKGLASICRHEQSINDTCVYTDFGLTLKSKTACLCVCLPRDADITIDNFCDKPEYLNRAEPDLHK